MTKRGVDGLSPKVIDTLQRLGLTEYGARCYGALVGLGEAEAATISDAADVPRTKVYGVLKDLVDAGWVTLIGGRPARYRAAPPEERVRSAEKEIADNALTVVRELQARQDMAAHMVPMSMYLLRGSAALTDKTFEVIRRARRQLVVLLGFTLPGEARELARAIEAARDRGVEVRLLVARAPYLGPIDGLDEFERLLRGARVSPFPFRAVIADLRQAVLVIPQPSTPPEEVVGFWNPTEAFVSSLAPVFEAAWQGAPPFAE